MDSSSNINDVIDRVSGEMKDTLASLQPFIPMDIVPIDNQFENDDFDPLEDFSMNLPELIARMKDMVTLMETNTKIYESLKSNTNPLTNRTDSTSDEEEEFDVDTRQSLWLNDSGRQSTFTPRDSVYAPRESSVNFRDSMVGGQTQSWRANVFQNSTSSLRETIASVPEEFAGKDRQSFNFSESFKKVPLRRNAKPTSSRLRLDNSKDKQVPIQTRRVDYQVKWTHGDLGISLNNFTKDRRGYQVSSLGQSAQCFTTGIGNARLGDVLMYINNHDVEHLPSDQIKDILLSTSRPMVLGFRSNPNTVTSPTSAKHFRDNQRVFEECEDEVAPHLVLPEAPVKETAEGRTTDSTVCESVYNDELEDWLRRQDEMHSDLVLLLTETIHRCESLKEANFDELQKMMERAMRRRASSAAVSHQVYQ